MSMAFIWLFIAMGLTIVAYGFYWWGIRRQLVRPNRSSWLIWSAVTTVEALTYQAVNEGLLQNIVFFMNAASCLFITFAVWRQSAWQKPSNSELFCMALAAASLILWLGFHEQTWAHILVVAAVPVGFLPTWYSALEDRRRELSPAWGFWSLADFSTLMVVMSSGRAHGMDLPYILIEFVCHAIVWLIIGLGTINPWSALQVLGGKKEKGNSDAQGGGQFIVGKNNAGKAVYANRPFPTGAKLIRFSGPIYHKSEIFVHRTGEDDRFFQVGPDEYMGPSGDIDDIVNHSCRPNAGLRFAEKEIFLVALRPIQTGEEICWDYSTTSSSSTFYMKCLCAVPECRGIIGDFEFLEPELQDQYRQLELVPPYLQTQPPACPSTLAA